MWQPPETVSLPWQPAPAAAVVQPRPPAAASVAAAAERVQEAGSHPACCSL